MYTALRKLRTALVKEAPDGVMAYHIFINSTLQQISRRIPRTKEELLEINGLGTYVVLYLKTSTQNEEKSKSV
jgi:bloom syndrome protein